VNSNAFFEEWVGVEVWKRMQYLGEGRLHYLRTRDGMEIDFIIEHADKLVPIEVKWTERPSESDERHLRTFLKEHPRQAGHAYLICRCTRPQAVCDNVTALPWFCL
jgi:predicted AAA+ superfamily ATPase